MTPGRRRHLPLAALALAALAAPASAAPAAAAEPQATALAPVQRTLAAATPQRRTCSARLYGAAPGVATTRWTAPVDGRLTATMRGPASQDWDLALFDSAGGRLLDGSAGFGSNEVATAWVRAGDAVAVQACRRTGAGDSMPVSLAFVAVEPAANPARASLVQIAVDGRADAERLASLGLDLVEGTGPHAVDAVLHSDSERARLQAAGYHWRVLVADLAAQDRRDRIAEGEYARRAGGRSKLTSGRTTYRDYVDYQNDLKALAEAHPSFIRKVVLPLQTVQGRDIEGVEIAKDVDATDDGRPVYVEMGLHHAREWPSGEAVMEYGLDLAAGYGANPRLTALVEKERTFILPVINADGFVSSRQTGYSGPCDDDPNCSNSDAQSGSGSYRRKNCRDDPSDAPTQADPCDMLAGVDLNRNYGAYWGGPGASADWSSQVFRGPAPFSEPEAEAVHRFSAGLQITTLVSNHNYAGLVLRPPGFESQGLAPDEARLKVLGDAMADATGYDSQYGYQLYEVTGATEDWNYVAQGTFGYTIELGGPNFHPAYQTGFVDQYEGTGAQAGRGVREAFVLAGEQAADPADHSIIRGAAPPGATLRIQKTFTTPTSTGLELPDHLESTLTVPASGRYTWNVNPSTRPFVGKAGGVEAWTMTCETGGRVQESRAVVVARGGEAQEDFGCPPPASRAAVASSACRDRTPPRSRARRARRTPGGKTVITGRTTDRGCPGGGGVASVKGKVARVRVALARRARAGRCSFVGRSGRFGRPRSCRRPVLLRARGTRSWRLTLGRKLPRGRYRVLVRATDAAGNTERRSIYSRLRVR